MNEHLARQTISAIENALEDEQTAAIWEILQLVQKLANKPSEVSIAELSDLVGRDPAITEKIISASNTLAFKVGGARISQISEAVGTLGFEKVRNLAISILLLENARHMANPYEQREIASLSVCSGLLAEFLTQSENLNVNPELAFVCSSLRNYGKLLMASFAIEEYRKAKKLAIDMEYDEAYRSVFGMQPLDLGQHILKSANLPQSITATLKDLSPKEFARLAKSPKEQLLAISELGVLISEVIFDSDVVPEEFEISIQRILDRFERNLPISLSSIIQALIEIDANLRNFSQTIGTDSSAAPAAKILKARVNGDALPELPNEAKRSNSQAKSKSISEMDEQERETYAEANFQKAVKRISAEGEEQQINMGNIYEIATQAILDGLDLSSCMVFTRETNESSRFAARFGHGELLRSIRNRPLVSKTKRDIFGICINRKEDILIQEVNAGNVHSVIPDWINTDAQNESLIVLPVIAEEQVFAIILGSVDQGTIQLGKGDHRRLKEIRLLLIELELRSRQAILNKKS